MNLLTIVLVLPLVSALLITFIPSKSTELIKRAAFSATLLIGDPKNASAIISFSGSAISKAAIVLEISAGVAFKGIFKPDSTPASCGIEGGAQQREGGHGSQSASSDAMVTAEVS